MRTMNTEIFQKIVDFMVSTNFPISIYIKWTFNALFIYNESEWWAKVWNSEKFVAAKLNGDCDCRQKTIGEKNWNNKTIKKKMRSNGLWLYFELNLFFMIYRFRFGIILWHWNVIPLVRPLNVVFFSQRLE